MATQLFAMGANDNLEDVISGPGAANSAGVINLTIDLTTSGAYTEVGGTRAITKAEVIEGIEVLKQYIIRGNWTPA